MVFAGTASLELRSRRAPIRKSDCLWQSGVGLAQLSTVSARRDSGRSCLGRLSLGYTDSAHSLLQLAINEADPSEISHPCHISVYRKKNGRHQYPGSAEPSLLGHSEDVIALGSTSHRQNRGPYQRHNVEMARSSLQNRPSS